MSAESSRESLVRAIEDLHRVIRKRNDEISTLRMECRDLAAEVTAAHEALTAWGATEPRPLAVGDRVKIVVPEDADGVRMLALAVSDVGTVVAEADEDGDILFRRDGTETSSFIAAANVERIEDDPPRVGDIVRVDRAERADGETEWLPEVGKEYRVLFAVDSDGDLVTAKDDDGLHRIVDARNVTVVRRAEG